MKERIKWIDIAKGITIILVVIGHLNVNWFPSLNLLISEIYTFHMPLFFMLSGVTFSVKKESKFIDFVKKKFKSLMIPYFVFSGIALIKPIGKMLLNMVRGIDSINFFEILKQCFNIFIMGNGLWFLPCLFIAECILYGIMKITNNDKKKTGIILLFFSIIGYAYLTYLNVNLPLKINVALLAVVFVGIGALLKNTEIINKLKDERIIIVFLMINLCVNIITYKIYGSMTDIGKTTNYLCYFIPAISGSLFIIGISQKIESNKYLQYLGTNSLVIYIFNDLVLKIYKAIIMLILKIEIQNLIFVYQYLIAILLTVLAIVTMIPIIKILDEKFPCLIGKKKALN